MTLCHEFSLKDFNRNKSKMKDKEGRIDEVSVVKP